MSFDTLRETDVRAIMDKAPEDILAYGYFTDAEPEKAKLIAKTAKAYGKLKETSLTADKISLKVARRTSNTILALTTLKPRYVSLNTDIGKTDCKKLFPSNYDEEEDEEEEEDEAEADADNDETKE